MPLLDNFTVDHTGWKRYVRVAAVPAWRRNHRVHDLLLRAEQRSDARRGSATWSTWFAGFMRNHLNGNGVEIIDISPMGCRTGFIWSDWYRQMSSVSLMPGKRQWKTCWKCRIRIRSGTERLPVWRRRSLVAGNLGYCAESGTWRTSTATKNIRQTKLRLGSFNGNTCMTPCDFPTTKTVHSKCCNDRDFWGFDMWETLFLDHFKMGGIFKRLESTHQNLLYKVFVNEK